MFDPLEDRTNNAFNYIKDVEIMLLLWHNSIFSFQQEELGQADWMEREGCSGLISVSS